MVNKYMVNLVSTLRMTALLHSQCEWISEMFRGSRSKPHFKIDFILSIETIEHEVSDYYSHNTALLKLSPKQKI